MVPLGVPNLADSSSLISYLFVNIVVDRKYIIIYISIVCICIGLAVFAPYCKSSPLVSPLLRVYPRDLCRLDKHRLPDAGKGE